MFHNIPWKKKEDIKKLIEVAFPTHMGKAIEWYLIVLLVLYPMVLCRFRFFSISMQTNIFCIASLVLMTIYFRELQKGNIPVRSVFRNFEYLTIALFLFNVILMIVKIIRTDIFYEPSIIIISLCCMYVLLSRAGKFYRRYLYYVILSAIVPFFGVLFHFFINAEKTYLMDGIVKNPAVTASYALLVLTIAVLLYCIEKQKELRVFAGILAGLASFVLFLQKNSIAVWIGGILFLVIPLLFVPTAQLIKRKMQMAFLYFFLLSNMPILTNYTKWMKKEISFDLTSSIYLDLVIAVVGMVFFNFWDKIPEDSNLEEMILYKIRKTYRGILAAISLTFFMLAFAGNSIQTIPEFMGQERLLQVTTNLQKGYWYQEGGLYAALKEFGIIGAICFITILAMMLVRIKKNYNKKEQISAILTTICTIFFIQSVFYKPNTLVTPIYFVVIIFAINNKRKRKVWIYDEQEREEQEHEEMQEDKESSQGETEPDEPPLEMLDINN